MAAWDQVSGYPGFGAGHDGGTWIPISSSNVDAIRWLAGNDYKLQVRFKTKDKQPGRCYEYQVPETAYDELFSAASPGRFVWHYLRKGNFPYREVTGTVAAYDYPPSQNPE